MTLSVLYPGPKVQIALWSVTDKPTRSDFSDVPAPISDSLFVAIRDFFRHLNPVVRAGAGFASATCFNWAWTMSQNEEYLPSIIVTTVAVAFALIALYRWTAIEQRPTFTRVVKWVVGLGALL